MKPTLDRVSAVGSQPAGMYQNTLWPQTSERDRTKLRVSVGQTTEQLGGGGGDFISIFLEDFLKAASALYDLNKTRTSTIIISATTTT